MNPRGATVADLRRFAARLPEVDPCATRSGRGRRRRRAAHRRDRAVDGRREAEHALVEGPGTPFLTAPHFDGCTGVLVRGAHLHQLSPDELEEVVVEACLARAKRLARQWLADGG